MLVSKNWLNEYVDISDIKSQKILEDMPLIGNEIEEIYKISDATNLVIGKVIECVDHPKSDHLHVCNVDIGSEVLQIVCGANNVKKDIYVIVAVDGSSLPGGITIKKTMLRDVESNGMLCSLQEIGIQEKYVPEEFKNGIYVIDGDDDLIGLDALKYLEYDDEVINFELTANRGDLLSMIGMAYEFSSIYDKEVKLPINSYNTISDNVKNYINLNVQTKNCPLYIAKMVRNVKLGDSPKFIKSRLMSSGIRPINNVVDISNYVMLEYGQPLHFFDSDKLGNNITVRMAKSGEVMTTLDGIKRTLDNNDIVIANDTEIVALAGVMGGFNTEIENTTKNVTIEAAIFNPVNIRNTSKKIIKSEASSRYEKGIDSNRTKEALDRACHLLEKYADAEILDGYATSSIISRKDKIIDITFEKICSVLGMNISNEEISSILSRLGFEHIIEGELLHVKVPSRRLDVSIKEDLIEEIGRIHGYTNMIGTLPNSIIKRGSVPSLEKYKSDIRKYMLSLGLSEVVTYTLTDVEKSKMFTNDILSNIEVMDPLSEDKKLTRYSLIPSLLEVSEYNSSRNINDINIFEISNIYYKIDDKLIEKSLCSGLMYGKYLSNDITKSIIDVDFYMIKGIIQKLFNYLKFDGRYEFVVDNIPNEMHPYRTASIYINKKYVGMIGQVHPSISKDKYVFELDIDELYDLKIRNIKYKEISKYPNVVKDMSFILPKNMESKIISNYIKKNSANILKNVEVFDVYTGENIDSDKKSVSYKLIFSDLNRTLTDEEVMKVFNNLIEKIEKEFDATLRNK